jgi:hypothetical protein
LLDRAPVSHGECAESRPFASFLSLFAQHL